MWAEPTFAVAEAQSESVTPSNPDALHESSADNAKDQTRPEASSPSTAQVATAVDTVLTQEDRSIATPAAVSGNAQDADPICKTVKAAAEAHDIPIGFFVRLLWQESRFKATEVSSAGAQGIAQFMPQTAVEIGLKNPFDPLQAIPASARFLRKLYDQFGNLGLAAAAYNAGGGRIEKWLSRRSSLPKETQAYVKIITGHKAEAWTDEQKTVFMPTDLPQKAPCEGVGGLSRSEQMAAVNVDLTPAASAMVRKAEAGDTDEKEKAAPAKSRVAISEIVRSRNARGRSVVLATKLSRKAGKQTILRLASARTAR
ncbi:MAG: lytic transglycosylase domain-containing protein [Bradyrhizobium sp.]